jgi:hypothetical protein
MSILSGSQVNTRLTLHDRSSLRGIKNESVLRLSWSLQYLVSNKTEGAGVVLICPVESNSADKTGAVPAGCSKSDVTEFSEALLDGCVVPGVNVNSGAFSTSLVGSRVNGDVKAGCWDTRSCNSSGSNWRISDGDAIDVQHVLAVLSLLSSIDVGGQALSHALSVTWPVWGGVSEDVFRERTSDNVGTFSHLRHTARFIYF